MPSPARGARQHATNRSIRSVSSTRDELLAIPEVIAELGVAKATYYRWRQLGKAPRSIRLPNGQVRVRRSELERWLDSHIEEDAAALTDGAA